MYVYTRMYKVPGTRYDISMYLNVKTVQVLVLIAERHSDLRTLWYNLTEVSPQSAAHVVDRQRCRVTALLPLD